MTLDYETIHKTFKFINMFCFGYPFVMAWYWITGSFLYFLIRERHEPPAGIPPALPAYPFVSVLLPCFNESEQLEETMSVLMQLDYPNFEVIAINDGSSDDTATILNSLLMRYPKLRVAHLVENQGKSTALNTGLFLSKGEILVCIDGDALLDPHAATWFVRNFQTNKHIGALTGNPRIRNRSTLLGRLQIGEFSSIVGMIKRTQTVYGSLFTVSGVICAFRKAAVMEAGFWSPGAMTDDVDLTLRIQSAGWDVAFEPKALCWILMPEKLKGLWRQRLRWSEGGSQAVLKVTKEIVSKRAWGLVPILLNFYVSTIWAFCILGSIAFWCAMKSLGLDVDDSLSPIPDWWGTILSCTYLFQSIIGLMLDSRYEKGILKSFAWIIWYPLLYWLMQSTTAALGFLRALKRPAQAKGTWISPDRGIKDD